MNIQWLGQACFRISEKIDTQEVSIVTAPFGKSVGLFPPKLKADIVTVNRLDSKYGFTEKINGNIDSSTLVIDRPGEYETKKIFINAIEHLDKNNQRTLIFRYEIGNLSLAHLGGLSDDLNEKELDFIGDIDILLVPVGGTDVLTGVKAAEVVRQIEPRLVIPMEYKIKGLTLNLGDEKKFIQEMGGKSEIESKLKISRKDLSEDSTKLVILQNS